MVVARHTLVLVDPDERRAHPIPDSFKEQMRAFEGDDLEIV
jgi:acyl-CoA thioesterase FadM